MIKALILDCFGVFFADPIFKYMRNPNTLPEDARALHTLDDQAAHGLLSKSNFIEKASVILGSSHKDIEQIFFQQMDRNDELLDMILKARDTYKFALLSNIGADMMDGFFTPNERQSIFDTVILSGEVKLAKPDPAIFELTLGELGVQPAEAVFIDDSENHIKGALALGIPSIQFESNLQLKTELAKIGVNI